MEPIEKITLTEQEITVERDISLQVDNDSILRPKSQYGTIRAGDDNESAEDDRDEER